MPQPITLFHIHDLAEDQTQEFHVNHHDLLAIKKDGQIYLYENICPHLQISLNFMPNEFLDGERHFITCANHCALFEIETGLCIAGPCVGQSLKKINFTIQDGAIQLTAI